MPKTKNEGFPIRKPYEPITLEMIRARIVEEGDCWLWQGATSHGQPIVNWNRKATNLRRYMAEHIQGRKVKGLLASTCCGNMTCVAPDHVSMKTRRQLLISAAQRTLYAEQLPRRIKLAQLARARSKITTEIAKQIREAEGSQRAIAKLFGVSYTTVSKIKTGKTWVDYSSPWAGLMLPPSTESKPCTTKTK